MVTILLIAECIFKLFLGDAPSNISLASKSLRMKMKNAAMRELLKNDILRLLRYEQTFTEDKILNSNIGKRQVYTKLNLFKGFIYSLQTLLLFTDFNHYLVYFCEDGL